MIPAHFTHTHSYGRPQAWARGHLPPPPPENVKEKVRFASIKTLVCTKRTKTLPPDTFYGFKIYLRAFAAGALPRSPSGGADSAAPDPIAGFEGTGGGI